MTLENIQPLVYLGQSGEHCFVPSIGVEMEQARQLTMEFAEHESQIYMDALGGVQREGVIRTPDEKWVVVKTPNFDIISENKNRGFSLTKSDFYSRLGRSLGIDTCFGLSTGAGRRFLFDPGGNFAMVSEAEAPDSFAERVFVDKYGFTKMQMSAVDFEYVEYMLKTMGKGVSCLSINY